MAQIFFIEVDPQLGAKQISVRVFNNEAHL